MNDGTIEGIKNDPMATRDDIVSMMELINWKLRKTPEIKADVAAIAALNHVNCPADLWWQFAASYPIDAIKSPLFDLFSFEVDTTSGQLKWVALLKENIDRWIYEAFGEYDNYETIQFIPEGEPDPIRPPSRLTVKQRYDIAFDEIEKVSPFFLSFVERKFNKDEAWRDKSLISKLAELANDRSLRTNAGFIVSISDIAWTAYLSIDSYIVSYFSILTPQDQRRAMSAMEVARAISKLESHPGASVVYSASAMGSSKYADVCEYPRWAFARNTTARSDAFNEQRMDMMKEALAAEETAEEAEKIVIWNRIVAAIL